MNKLKTLGVVVLLYYVSTTTVFVASVIHEDRLLILEAQNLYNDDFPNASLEYRAAAMEQWYCRNWLFPWGPIGYFACFLHNDMQG